MRTLILHCGLMKCGSTSIQWSLFQARDLLDQRGIAYWPIMPNHNEPLRAMSRKAFRKISPARAAQFGSAEEIEGNLRAFLAAPSEFSIISSEYLGRLRGAGNADPGPNDIRGRLRRAVMQAGFERIRIVGYVRPPTAWWTSMIQERAKSLPWAEAIQTRTEYRPMIEPLEALFPEAEVALRLFDPANFIGGSILNDFFDLAGMPAQHAEGIDEVRANPSLSHEATLYLDHLLRQMGDSDSLGMAFFDHYLRPDFETGRRFQLPRDLLLKLAEENRDDLAWISARMGRDMTPVIPDEAPPAVAPDQMNDLSARLILHLLRENRMLRSERALSVAQSSLQSGNRRLAYRQAVKALHAWPESSTARDFIATLKRGQ